MALEVALLHLEAPAGAALLRCVEALGRFENKNGEPLRVVVLAREAMDGAKVDPELVARVEDEELAWRQIEGDPAQALRAALEAVHAAPAEAVLATAAPGWAQAAESAGVAVLALDDGWETLALRLAQRYFRGDPAALEAGLGAWLAARHDAELVNASAAGKDALEVRAKAWVALRDPRLQELDGLEVRLPLRARVRLGGAGESPQLDKFAPSADALGEAVDYVLSLKRHGAIGLPGSGLPAGATHVIEVDADGRRRLQRRRFAAQ